MQILHSIIGACSFLLLLFSLHLFFAKHGNRLLNRFLSVVFFARFGHIVIYLLINSDQVALFPFFQKLFLPFYFAAPACLYLYITGFINGDTRLKKLEWLHFIPAFLAVIHVLPWQFSSPIQWGAVAKEISDNSQILITERTGLFPSYFYYLGRPLLLLGYLIAAWRLVLISGVISEKNWNLNKMWILFCLSIATFFNVLSLLPLVFDSLDQSLTSHPWFITLNCLMLLSVMVFVFHQPRILYGYLFIAANWKAAVADAKEQQPQSTPSAPKNNLLPDQLSAYTAAMKEFMESEKPFLLPDFQIVHLAQKLNIPVHHCSFVINNIIGKNFREWINAYRVNDFITEHPILSDKMTIEAIAHKSGFKSVATFYNAFKKETGLMPKAYFQKIEQELGK